MPFGEIYPNLFIAWIAPTTLWNKTTALNIARDLAWRVFPHLLAPQDTTPEGFLSDLAGREPMGFESMSQQEQETWRAERNYCAQRGLVLDELSGLMAGAGKDYNSGLLEAFLRFYDCDPHYTRSTRGQGRLVVRNSYLTLLGASTPAAMAQHLGVERLWAMGWWPRFALLAPDSERPDWLETCDAPEPPELVAGLKHLNDRLPRAEWPTPPAALDVVLGDGVFDLWKQYAKIVRYDLLNTELDEQLWGTYGRLGVQVLKIAMLLAALDWGCWCSPVIEIKHLLRSIGIGEAWRASAHRVIGTANMGTFDRLRQRITRQLARHEPGGGTLRDLYRAMKDKTPAHIEQALMQMLAVGEIEEVPVAADRKGGRPTRRYRIARD